MSVRPVESPKSAEIQLGLQIPLRDGIFLGGARYSPSRSQGPLPCICALTPYMSDGLHQIGRYYAANGFHFISVDVRGRGDSDGTFHPHLHDAKDGYDVVEWIATQQYCNGRVAMYGGSYLGHAQWMTAKERPPHLVTIVPVAAPCLAVDAPMRNNIWYPYNVQWAAMTSGRTYRAKLGNDLGFWAEKFRTWHQSGMAFSELVKVVAGSSTWFQEDIEHPEPDAYWDAQNPTREEYALIEVPILTVTGSYDDDQPGAIEHYRRHLAAATPEAQQRHYLLIGPWDHFGAQLPCAEFGGLKVGPASVIDIHKLHLEWYAWCMQEGPKPALLQRSVGYYVMGADEWCYADRLDEITEVHRPYFLSSNGSANDLFASGSLELSPRAGPPDSYNFDPRITQGPEVEAESQFDGKSIVDQRFVLALSGRLLVYHSEPFTEDTEVSGFFGLSAWISIDCPDTDLYVSVYQVNPDGTSVRLSTDAMRARYRNGLRKPRLIHTLEPLLYKFQRFTFVSRRLSRGSRLRLVIAPLGHLVDGVFAQKNFNGGGVVAKESMQDARAVTVKLFHDAERFSALFVPIGRKNCPSRSTQTGGR